MTEEEAEKNVRNAIAAWQAAEDRERTACLHVAEMRNHAERAQARFRQAEIDAEKAAHGVESARKGINDAYLEYFWHDKRKR